MGHPVQLLQSRETWGPFLISNSLPTNEDNCSSVISTWSVCYSGAQRYCVSPSQINMGDRPKRMSRPPRRFVEEFCHLREKTWRKWNENAKNDRNLYDVEVIEEDTTRKQLKIHHVGFSHEYDEWRDYVR